MLGLKDNGIIATAKRFPGHGDTDSDSHYTLPMINHNRERLDSIELYPFKLLIGRGARCHHGRTFVCSEPRQHPKYTHYLINASGNKPHEG